MSAEQREKLYTIRDAISDLFKVTEVERRSFDEAHAAEDSRRDTLLQFNILSKSIIAQRYALFLTRMLDKGRISKKDVLAEQAVISEIHMNTLEQNAESYRNLIDLQLRTMDEMEKYVFPERAKPAEIK